MFKRILILTLTVLLSGGLAGGYFYHVRGLVDRGKTESLCSRVDLNVLDSLQSGIVDRKKVLKYLSDEVIGEETSSINTCAIERTLRARGDILWAEAFIKDRNTLSVQITQRKPVLRLDGEKGRHYCDKEGYIFPVSNSVNLPIITGNIPFSTTPGYIGPVPEQEKQWLLGMIALTKYIQTDNYWNRAIEQIDISSSGDIVFYTNICKQKIIFGECGERKDIEEKFSKLKAYFENIVPEVGPNKYETIDLKYKKQIICR